jgi:hypothetical protein
MIDEQHLEWALCHLEAFGGSDVFPPSHDYPAIRANWEAVKSYVLNIFDGTFHFPHKWKWSFPDLL